MEAAAASRFPSARRTALTGLPAGDAGGYLVPARAVAMPRAEQERIHAVCGEDALDDMGGRLAARGEDPP
jgi:hypothetical protein